MRGDFYKSAGVHCASVLNSVLFKIIVNARLRVLRLSCPWELLQAHHLVVIA